MERISHTENANEQPISVETLQISEKDKELEGQKGRELFERNKSIEFKMTALENAMGERQWLNQAENLTGLEGVGKEAKAKLSGQSRVVKGVLINGLAAAGMMANLMDYNEVSDVIDGIMDFNDKHQNFIQEVGVVGLLGLVAGTATTIQNDIKAISQIIKIKLSNNKVFQAMGVSAEA